MRGILLHELWCAVFGGLFLFVPGPVKLDLENLAAAARPLRDTALLVIARVRS